MKPLSTPIAALCWFAIFGMCVGVLELSRAQATEKPLPENYRTWLDARPVEPRHWWQTLKLSLFGEAGVDKAKVRATREGFQISGKYQDNDAVRPEITSLAGGVKVEGKLP